MRLKTALVAAVTVMAFISGVWLLLSPHVQQRDALKKQNELLESIESADGITTAGESVTAQTPDFDGRVLPSLPTFYETEQAPKEESFIHPTASPEPVIPTETLTEPLIAETPIPDIRLNLPTFALDT